MGVDVHQTQEARGGDHEGDNADVKKYNCCRRECYIFGMSLERYDQGSSCKAHCLTHQQVILVLQDYCYSLSVKGMKGYQAIRGCCFPLRTMSHIDSGTAGT